MDVKLLVYDLPLGQSDDRRTVKQTATSHKIQRSICYLLFSLPLSFFTAIRSPTRILIDADAFSVPMQR